MKIDTDMLATRYEDIFRSEGYNVVKKEKDSDGDWQMVVKLEGLSFLIVFDSKDTNFVRVILPNFYSLDTDDEKMNALLAVSDVAKRCKAAKVYLNNSADDMIATCEFLDGGESVDASLLIRYMNMVKGAAGVFAEKMAELGK